MWYFILRIRSTSFDILEIAVHRTLLKQEQQERKKADTRQNITVEEYIINTNEA
jgi:hypothetical protein